MPEIHKNNLDIRHIITAIGTNNAYGEERNHEEARELTENDNRRRAIGKVAMMLSNEHESGYMSLEAHAMNITAQLTTFTENERRLEELVREGASYKEKLPLRQAAVEFNHAIKDMIDSNPTLQYDEVLSFMRNMNQAINGSEDNARFEQKARMILTGMRHEIAAEQMFLYMPGLEYRDVTIDEDLKGADYFVSINGTAETRIDIKASNATAQKKRQIAVEKGYSPHTILWSQATEQDFNGGFRIPAEVAAAKAPFLYTGIQQAIRSQQTPSRQAA